MEEVKYELRDWKFSSWRDGVTWIAAQNYDIIHIQYPARFYGYLPDLALLTWTVRRSLPDTPIVVTIHEFRITHYLRKMTTAVIVHFADAVVLTAESEARRFGQLLWWMNGKIRLIHLAGVIPMVQATREEREDLRQSRGFRPDDIVIAYFGFLHPNKGVERLLSSFALVHARRPSARLLVISLFQPDSVAYHRRISLLTREEGIDHVVTWTGFAPRESVSCFLSMADIGVLPYEDGVSFRRLSFMTMMSHGLPTVTTVGDTLPGEMDLREGDNVSTVPAGGTPEQLAARLVELVDSPELRKRLAQGGRTWARPYQWETVVKESMQLYDSLMRRAANP
jgi:glycosyltransferase involved in cell wall biosynthesis